MVAPRGPENRVRDAILCILVVGELRGMIFKRLYDKLRKKVVPKVFRFTKISTGVPATANQAFALW